MTKQMTMIQAITDAMDTILTADETAMILGEDVGKNGGVFRATDGLQEKHGEHRVVDTPLSEAGIIGSALGLAINGIKPIAEIQFLGFIYPAYEQIMTHVSRLRMRTLSHYTVPMVIRAPYGAGIRSPEIHSDSTEILFTHMPGIKVVCPSTPYDAKGLLLAAMADPDPVLFLEPMRSYRAMREDVPNEAYTVPLGKGIIRQEGTDVTLFGWGAMMPVIDKAAKMAAEQGITCEIIDLRTLYPLDEEIIAQSVQKTTRAVVVHEAHRTGGLSNDIASVISEHAFLYLRAPVIRVTGYDVPVPFFSLENDYLPTAEKVLAGIYEAMNY